MKLLKLISSILLIFLSHFSNSQTVHRVTSGADLQAIIDTAAGGDIYILEGGIYGDIITIKKVIIYGTGFYTNSCEYWVV
jgi:hypothetical protein